jgi:hypothetical protein
MRPDPIVPLGFVRVLAVAVLLRCAGAALAADALTDALSGAYAPYRAALFRTNSGSQSEAEQSVAAALEAFAALQARFGARPPAPYDRDPKLVATLDELAAVLVRAQSQVRARELGRAHETLEQVRDLLADLRRRNGVIVYSDHMNAYHAQMEHLLQAGPRLLEAPPPAAALIGEAAVLDFLARRLRSEAGTAQTADTEFAPALREVEASVAALRAAVDARDAVATRAALGALKRPYSRLFLRFG